MFDIQLDVDLADNNIGGFFGNTGANSSYSQYDLVEIPEVDHFNITLAAYKSCPGDGSEGCVSSVLTLRLFG